MSYQEQGACKTPSDALRQLRTDAGLVGVQPNEAPVNDAFHRLQQSVEENAKLVGELWKKLVAVLPDAPVGCGPPAPNDFKGSSPLASGLSEQKRLIDATNRELSNLLNCLEV